MKIGREDSTVVGFAKNSLKVNIRQLMVADFVSGCTI